MRGPFEIPAMLIFLFGAAIFPAGRAALEAVGFAYYELLDVDMFIDGPKGRPSEAVHLLYAGEKIKPEYEHGSPELDESGGRPSFKSYGTSRLTKDEANRLA